MAKEICISSTPHETRLAILEDDQLAEIYYERENEYTLAGSIYNGRVTRVLPGMQSAFVDLGLERDAFLYVTDFIDSRIRKRPTSWSGLRLPGRLRARFITARNETADATKSAANGAVSARMRNPHLPGPWKRSREQLPHLRHRRRGRLSREAIAKMPADAAGVDADAAAAAAGKRVHKRLLWKPGR